MSIGFAGAVTSASVQSRLLTKKNILKSIAVKVDERGAASIDFGHQSKTGSTEFMLKN